jgi:hypothetical protein
LNIIKHVDVCFKIDCNPYGTYTDRDGRCICKYNVEGDRCDQCKRNHYYLNPTTPNGCLSCFCSGVSSDCTSTDWRRQAVKIYCFLFIINQ